MNSQNSFEIVEGSPTITFATDGVEKMLPYFSLQEADFDGDTIRIQFTHWTVDVVGSQLEKLWKHLSAQDVGSIAVSEGEPARCEIVRIQITERDGEQ